MRKAFISIVIVLIIGLLSACKESDEPITDSKDESIPVETTSVIKDDLIVSKKIYGRTMPSKITPVMIEIPGEIDVIEVKNGDQVKEDDLIAKLKTQAGIQEVKATEGGEITELELEEGDLASNTEPLALIMDMEQLHIKFSVTSNVRSLFDKESTYEAIINDKEFDIKIKTIHSMPDETGLYPVEATVKNKEKHILPGMIAMLTIPENRVQNALILPTSAIIEDSDGAYIYVVEDQLATKKEINIIESQTDQTAFEGDVDEGAEVIINGQLTVSDGSKVQIVEGEN